MKNWGKRLAGVFFGGKGSGARKMARPGRTRRVGMEALEERQLLSVSGSIEAGASSGVFLSGQALAEPAAGPQVVSAADLDGDGDTDVISGLRGAGAVVWYENDGSQDFATHKITNVADDPCSLATGDLDGDGDVDVLVAANDSDTITWFENDGSGKFEGHVITTEADGVKSVYAADVDGDGDLDVLSASERDDTIAWYENEGSGAAFTKNVISNSADGAASVFAADMDGDGDLDVLSAAFVDDEIAWYENDGSEHFTKRVISYSADGACSVFAADMDGDGDMDVVSASSIDETVAWYRNDGTQRFSTKDIYTSSDGLRSIYVADVDSDGDLDVLSASYSDYRIRWHENIGANFSTLHVLSSTAKGATCVFAADVDGDGSTDVLSASIVRDKVVWYDCEAGGASTAHVISPVAAKVRTIDVVDVNADGVMDVVSASNNVGKIAWYEGNGDGSYTFHTIAVSETSTSDTFAADTDAFTADVDGDGDVDVISASRGLKLCWHENDGAGNFTTHQISSASSILVCAADLDGDGDMDIVSGARGSNAYWYENDGEENFTEHLIATTKWYYGDLTTEDMDGDGDVDILAAFSNGTVAWYENDGSGNVVAHTILTGANEPRSVVAVDLDDDGDMDFLLGTKDDGTIAWYENDGEQGFTSHTITTSADYLYSVFSTDLDGDGDLDVLSGAATEDEVTWYENDGCQAFTERTFSSSLGVFYATSAADMDSDGDLDILAVSRHGDAIGLYEQVDGPVVDLGWVTYTELADVDATSGEADFFFAPEHVDRILTSDATYDPALGNVTLRLLDGQGNVVDEVSGSDGYARIDYQNLNTGGSYRLVVTGTNTSVDVRIANLVTAAGSSVYVYSSGTDCFEFSAADGLHASVNGVDYAFELGSVTNLYYYGKGTGTATLTGSSGAESVGLYPTHSTMIGVDGGFRAEVYDVPSVTAISGGGDDSVGIVDSRWDDTLTVTPTRMTLQGALWNSTAFSLTAEDFPEAHAYAREGGEDTAIFTGTSAAETLKTYPNIVKLLGAGTYNRAKFFEHVEADLQGGKDLAVVNPSYGADVLLTMEALTQIAYSVQVADGETPDFDALAYDVAFTNCERVVARGKGSNDWVEIHDSTENDVLIARSHKVEMMNGVRVGYTRGAAYRITVRGYQHVTAIADQGGTRDFAKLYDSGESGVDVWAAAYVDGKTWSSMTSPTRLLYEAIGFEYVGGYGFNNGLGSSHGTNEKEIAEAVDFAYQYGYWEGAVVSLPGSDSPATTRGEHASR